MEHIFIEAFENKQFQRAKLELNDYANTVVTIEVDGAGDGFGTVLLNRYMENWAMASKFPVETLKFTQLDEFTQELIPLLDTLWTQDICSVQYETDEEPNPSCCPACGSGIEGGPFEVYGGYAVQEIHCLEESCASSFTANFKIESIK
jgi:hypothetical protein